jgi:hypothetical protein
MSVKNMRERMRTERRRRSLRLFVFNDRIGGLGYAFWLSGKYI